MFNLNFRNWLQENENPENKKLVLVGTGSFSPIHLGHLKMFDFAKDWLEKRGYEVVGGFISPKHDNYLQGKLGDEFIPLQHRAEMIKRALVTHPWIQLDTWEARQNKPQSKFAVLTHIKTMMPPDVTPVFVGGDDLFYAPEHPAMRNISGHPVVTVPRNLPGEPTGGFSSSKVRSALASKTSIDKYLHPNVAQYMTQLSS